MTLKTMYPPQKDSPSTFLIGDITATDTLVVVGNASILPQTVPYPLTIGFDKSITETVMVTAIGSGNDQLTITRGPGALAWMAGVRCARIFTADDLEAVQDNIIEIAEQGSDNENRLDVVEPKVTANTDNIDSVNTTLTGQINVVKGGLTAEVTRAKGIESGLETNKINRTELPQVITDWVYNASGTALTLTITRYNASNKTTTTFQKTIPAVTNTTLGVMTPQAYNEITSLRNDVNALINQGGKFIGVSFATKAQLNSYVVPSTVKAGDYTYVLDDETQQDALTRYVYSGSVWNFAFVVNYDPVGIATNTTAGIVKSDSGTTEGKVFVETDGTMNVIGWSEMAKKSDIPTSLPANGGNAATVNGKTVAVNVPANANFNDTITTVNGKTGAISKADIVSLGIPAQDTITTISGKSGVITKADIVSLGMPAQDTVTSINGKTGAISKADIVALGIPAQDTVYTHPSSHPASMITQDANNRFVSDSEKANWNSKANGSHTHTASQVTAGALPVGVTATNSTDYTTSRLRNIRFGTTVPTSLANGEIYFMYE